MDEVCARRRAERTGTDQPRTLRRAETLLRSACVMLRDKPCEMVSSIMVSLPFDEGQTTDYLEGLAIRLANEYGLIAETAESGLHVKVCLWRAAAD
jgi:hypothetical protein